MSELPSAKHRALVERGDALRALLIGDQRPYQEIAAALRCTVRSVYNLAKRHGIPYMKILNVRHSRPEDFRQALMGRQSPRRRGRPPARRAR